MMIRISNTNIAHISNPAIKCHKNEYYRLSNDLPIHTNALILYKLVLIARSYWASFGIK